ncbi:MAG: glycosyltransferase, partial [bacterium]|nr:glycosyltransferase [bacterium]
MSVTIAIFVHDEIALLKRTLRSLRRNTKYPYQLLIINDAGSKKTRDYLYRLNNITLIRNTSRMGYAHCANIAIDHSDTPHILLLDSAAYVTEGWLTLLIDRLKENPAHGIAGPSTCLAWGDQSIQADPDWGVSKIESFAQELHQKQGNRFRCLDELHNVSGFCYCFKRELLEHIGYFDEAYGLGQCEDIDYNTRAAQAGYKALWVCGAYVHRFPLQRFGPGTGTLLERNKKLYQDKFCLLQIENRRSQYCTHCLGEKSEFFTKTINPKQVLRMPRQFTIISKSGNTTKIPMAPRQSAMDSAMTNTKDIGDVSHLQLVADSNYVNTGGGGSGDPIQLTADSKNGNTTEAGPVVQPQFRTDSKPPDTKDAGIFVSCIMPTYNRRSFVPKTIEYFLRQDYPNRELIIVDDGTDAIEDLVPQDPRIRYLGLTKKHTIGAKRNLAITNARGQIIIHWDDDDWMATHRI